MKNTTFGKTGFCETTVFAWANEIGISQTLENTTFGKHVYFETTVFACANEIENAQTLKNAMSGKMHFSEILVFAYANEMDIGQNTDISCVFVFPDAKIVQKPSFSLHFGAFRGLAKSLWVQIEPLPTVPDPPGSLSDHGLGGGFWSILLWGHFLNHFGVKFGPDLGSRGRPGNAQMLSK